MTETRAAQLAVDAHFDDRRQRAGDVVGHRRGDDRDEIQDHEDADGVQYALGDVVIERIALELRNDDVRCAACQPEENHDED